MSDLQEGQLSDEELAEINEVLECSRPAKFIVWEGEDLAQAKTSDSGAPCGTQLPPRGLTRGWEVCERCLKHPILKGALFFDLKEGGG
jgi:hypothetical protein